MRRALLVSAVLPAVLLAAGGCSSGPSAPVAGPGSSPAASASSAPSPVDPVPTPTDPVATPAGPAEASALAALPTGPATGTAVLAYAGVGEVREPFTGTCTHDGGTTRIEGTADTARITLTVAPAGATVVLEDVGFAATSTLATGRYDVAGRHLSLAAPLTSGDQPSGSIELELDCGS
ncbi:hypothetical protein KUM42_06645 [Modestobacter sp. L9-4]|uniref:hypothetical protein n=1 Tax=Modestobacter sp. L9-4 TaxID=2851567 RepID=UPI001C77B1F1|nr:hypothetical protein [Modestobacter sp. L9-4]QXG77191.1 hypothetical protein KUM42_06645 [Modestobacter sp. L9-4]